MVTQEFGRPSTDMFASYSKKQLDKYASQYPEPFSIVEDAFNMSWNELCLYLFPPFKSREGLRKDHGRSMSMHLDCPMVWDNDEHFSGNAGI